MGLGGEGGLRVGNHLVAANEVHSFSFVMCAILKYILLRKSSTPSPSGSLL